MNVEINENPPAASSEPEVTPSYQGLTPTLKVLVDKLVDMGFDMGVTSRAAEHFGADEKQVNCDLKRSKSTFNYVETRW